MISLHTHTRFSVGDALPSPEQIAKAVGHGGVVAMTDHDNLSGLIYHHRACQKHGVKPIYGMEATLASGGHLTLLAKTRVGLTSLFKLAATEKSWDDLNEHSKDVICMTGDISSPLHQAILFGTRDESQKIGNRLTDIYGDDLYFELIDHGLKEQKELIRRFHASKRRTIKHVYTNDVHYLNSSDAVAQAILIADRLSRKGDLDSIANFFPREAYLRDCETTAGTREILEKIGFDVTEAQVRLPQYDTGGKTELEFIKELCLHGLASYKKHAYENYTKRLEYELSVISSMGFIGYFLIVWDFIKWARQNGVPVGPGRGSGAGSLVAYVLGITDIDPIKYGLLFERFLNPERVSMPDFDIDFGQHNRKDVIDYVVRKYGAESVSQIGTFSELKPKSAWKSAARVLGVYPDAADAFSRYLPGETNALSTDKLSDIFDEDGNLMPSAPEEYQAISGFSGYKGLRPIIAVAQKLEGAYKAVGKHAAGLIITDGLVTDYIPAWRDDDSQMRYISQLDKDVVEDMGVVKFDFLGLSELDVIAYALKIIGDKSINMKELDMNDPKVYELISAGKTLGIFQIASPGLSSFCAYLKPECFNDLIAVLSLYRPGPMDMGMHEVYARRKNGLEDVEYDHPDLKSILGDTYGVIVYQEQVMAIAQKMAGYTLGGADLLRRAIGKKKLKDMEKQHRLFVDGGVDRGYTVELMNTLWSQIETFARYGFNKSHAAAYAYITFQTAWLKTYYPAHLFAAQMQVRKDSFEATSDLMRDAKSMGIEFHDPSVFTSSQKFRVLNGAIHAGLTSIKNLNEQTAHKVAESFALYDFASVFDMMLKVPMGEKDLKALIYSGALDGFFDRSAPLAHMRSKLLASMDILISVGKTGGQMLLFGSNETYVLRDPDVVMTRTEMLEKEFEYLGRYSTGHPVDPYARRARDVWGFSKIEDLRDGIPARIVGIIRRFKQITTKKGDLMCFLDIEDETGIISVTVFPSDYEEHGDVMRIEDDKPSAPFYLDIEVQEYNEQLRAVWRRMEVAS